MSARLASQRKWGLRTMPPPLATFEVGDQPPLLVDARGRDVGYNLGPTEHMPPGMTRVRATVEAACSTEARAGGRALVWARTGQADFRPEWVPFSENVCGPRQAGGARPGGLALVLIYVLLPALCAAMVLRGLLWLMRLRRRAEDALERRFEAGFTRRLPIARRAVLLMGALENDETDSMYESELGSLLDDGPARGASFRGRDGGTDG